MALIEEILNLEEDDFLKTKDLDKCRYCVYRSHCDRGIGAGDAKDFEGFQIEPEALEEEINFSEIQEIDF